MKSEGPVPANPPALRLFSGRHPAKAGPPFAISTSVLGGQWAAGAVFDREVRGEGAEDAERLCRLSVCRAFSASSAVMLGCACGAQPSGGLSFPPRRSRC